MAIKKLQNNFITPEQSKRLLELGVPADSADCSIDEWGRVHKIPQDNGNLLFSQLKRQTIYTIRPCWSVGRLIEICKICGSYELAKEIYGRALMYLNTVDGCICEMSYEINKGNLDFSKLED